MSANLVLAAVLGTAVLAPNGQQPGEKAGQPGHHAPSMQEKCAAACSDCQRACDGCAHHCGTMLAEGKKEHLTTLRTCEDCATVCAAAACVVARHGPFADTVC
jgi:hypothetical protein